MNSLTDRDFIDKLKEASDKELEVKLLIRGICCILPGIKGKTENIQAHSIVGRFLEHSRIYIFGRENPKIYIGSADLMTRNTEHRVEILCPIYQESIRKRILDYMDIQFKDNVKGRKFGSDGDLYKIEGEEKINSQEYFMKEEHEFVEDEKEKSSIFKSAIGVIKKLFKLG